MNLPSNHQITNYFPSSSFYLSAHPLIHSFKHLTIHSFSSCLLSTHYVHIISLGGSSPDAIGHSQSYDFTSCTIEKFYLSGRYREKTHTDFNFWACLVQFLTSNACPCKQDWNPSRLITLTLVCVVFKSWLLAE